MGWKVQIAAQILISYLNSSIYILQIKFSKQMTKKYVIFLFILIQCGLSQNCLKCQAGFCTNNICTKCENDFMLTQQGWCGLFTPIQGCRIYDAFSLDASRCLTCEDDRKLVNNRCYLIPPNCELIDHNRQCMKCKPNFQLQRGSCYTRDLQNCPNGTLPSVIPGRSFCQPITPQNCLTLNEEKICLSCDVGYTRAAGRCLKFSPTSSPCPNNACICPRGFFKFSQQCVQLQIDKCTLLRPDGLYCVACARGFVAILGICVQPIKQDDINCNVKAPLSDYCTGCNQDYFLDADAYCIKDFNLTSCPVSSNRFYLFANRCVYKDPRCDAVNFTSNNYQCIRCQDGFELTNGFCQRSICISLNSNGSCAQTFIGYTVVNGVYVKLPANCISLIPGATDRCAQCSQFTRNLTLTSRAGSPYICGYYDPYCVQYNTNGSCIQCFNEAQIDGYILKQRFCYRKAENCLRRDQLDLSRCLECMFNYHLDPADKKCYINVTGCQVYLNGSDCKQCALNFLLYDRKCYQANSECLDLDANNVCRRCSQGLIPFKNMCVYFHPYCLEYGPDRVCSQAAVGWTLGTGMTEQQKRYYRQFIMRGEAVQSRNLAVNLNGLTTTAGAGSYAAGAIIDSIPYANLLHTKINSINMFGQVARCNDGFKIVGNTCVKTLMGNCEQYSYDEVCIRCLPGFTLQGDFSCLQGIVCASQQQTLNGRCSRCAAGYLLMDAGQCFKIESTASIDRLLQSTVYFRYEYSNGQYIAWPRIFNCKNQRLPYNCSDCFAPYQNVNGECIVRIERCRDYGRWTSVPGSCLACEPGFTLWFGQCRRLNCPQVVNGTCLSCPANFYYYFGICLGVSLPNCRIYESGVCLLCSSGFYLSSQNQCLSQVAGCLTTNRDTGRCLECRFGLTLYRQRCVTQIMYCQDYNADNRCIRCLSNTVNRTQLLSSGLCGFLQGQCAKLNEATRQCAECNLGYSPITQDGRILCVSVRANCRTYDVRGRCIVCNPRYVLNNGLCKIFLQFCLATTPDGLTCTSCAAGSQLDGGCCKVPDPNCVNYNQCLCTTCLAKFYLDDTGRCVPNINGCDIYDKVTKRCLKCSNLFYLLADGTCLYLDQIANGCAQGFNITRNLTFGYQCVRCIDGFVLNTTDNLCYGYNCLVTFPGTRQCVSCPLYYKIYQPLNSSTSNNYCIPEFCDIYIPGQDRCVKNSSYYYGGFTIISITRTITIIYCTKYDTASGKCVQCSNFRYPNQNTLYGLCYPFHCRNALDFNCGQCEFGYGYTPNFPGSCVALFCQKYNADGSCATCTVPYTLSSSGICQNKGCCQMYDSQTNSCKQAKKYFTLQSGICTPVNCVKYDPTQLIICVECAKGYVLFNDGTCRINNCDKDSFTGDSCVQCIRGFRIQFLPASSKSICLPNYCASIATDLNSCLQCRQGFTLGPDKLCRSDFCAVYFPSLICQTCLANYRLQNQRCVADCAFGNATNCQCCKYGFSLNTTSALCQPADAFCLRKNPSSGFCQQCLPNYLIVSGQCVASVPYCRTPSLFGCLACTAGFQVVNNCRCIAKNCIKFNSNGTCQQCHPRFQITNEGLCKPRDCQFFSPQNWACNGCYGRFKFVDGICVTNDCDEWADLQSTTCKKCSLTSFLSTTNFVQAVPAQFQLVYGACYIKYCKNDPRQFACRECYPGYQLTLNRLCACIQVDPTTNTCKCPKGYIYNPAIKQCQINRDVCLMRDQTSGQCIQCPVKYQSPAQTKGECVVMFCGVWEAVSPRFMECRTCYPNFQLVGGFCQSALCLKFQNKTGFVFPQCVSCPSGYFPFSNYCIPNKCESQSYNLTAGTCSKCTEFGYSFSPDKSRCVIANCQIYASFDKCTKCKRGYFDLNGLCLAQNCSYFSQFTCTACLDGFTLSNEICTANNCQAFNQLNLCIRCKTGYELLKNYKCSLQNCQVDKNNRCQKCLRGFKYDQKNGRCIAVNCQRYLPSFQCQICTQGFYKQNGTCLDIYCDFNDRNAFSYEYQCLKCLPGYSFNNARLCYPSVTDICPLGRFFNSATSRCQPIPVSDCRIFVNNKCVWCAQGFFLFNSLCYSVRFCSKYSYFYGCYQCVPGYVLEGKQCKPAQSDPNCLQYAFNQCIKCIDGYLLASGLCVQAPPNCLQINSTLKCVRCAPGYLLNGDLCQIIDINCLSFDNQGRCARCKDSYYVNVQGQCQMNPQNCINVEPSGRCLQCFGGYSLQNGRCLRQIQFCLRYFENGFCSQCLENFQLTQNQCRCPSGFQLILNRNCFRLPQNCIQVDQNSLICIQCAPNYLLLQNFTCVLNSTRPPPQNCNIYDPVTGICRECSGNYVLSNNLCRLCDANQIKIGNSCYPIIFGCNSYDQNGLCRVCLTGYKLQNGRCANITVTPFCQIYDPVTGICQKCIQGYNKTSSNQCILNFCILPSADGRTCNKCFDYYSWTGRECRLETQFCLAYSNGQCLTCDSFSTLNQSRCIPNFCNNYDFFRATCLGCLGNYQLIARRCYIVIIGCSSYLINGTCSVCAPGYNLVNGLCQSTVVVQIPKFCITYNQTTSICVACAPGYSLTADSKLCILTNCQLMDPTGYVCNRCVSPFSWTGSVCQFTTDFCINYTAGYCSSCLSFSNLQRNRCVPNFCQSYNYNIGACQTCIAGYTLSLSLKRCFLIITYCIAYADTGACIQCQSGYTLANNGTVCQTSVIINPTCFAGSGQSCSRCKHRYFVDSQMCSAYIPYCINIDLLGRCISCCFGSTLINGTCRKDSTIRYCSKQVGNVCEQCLPNYSYCHFCDACLPVSPNCLQYSSIGDCLQCIQNFALLNGVCISPPVGQISPGTCRSGYYLKNGNCFKNLNDLKLYSQSRFTNIATRAQASQSTGSQNSDAYVVKSDDEIIIFGIVIASQGSVPSNASFLLYYRSKQNDPLVCWNSCIPTKIYDRNYLKQLVHPIVAVEVQIYLVNLSIQNASIDFRIL